MKTLQSLAALALSGGMAAAPTAARAAKVNLATLTCVKYQNEVLASPTNELAPDPINTVMWLFGYSVAKSGAHVMYGDALAAFGFGLDAECKDKPNEALLEALGTVKPSEKNPMDLNTLDCATFSQRHVDLTKTDRESADTIMMWLFGFATQKSGSHVFEADRLGAFATAFLAECAKHPQRSMYDSLSAFKF